MLKTLILTATAASTLLFGATDVQAQRITEEGLMRTTGKARGEYSHVIREEKVERSRTNDDFFNREREEIQREKQRPLFQKGQRTDSLFAPPDRGKNSLGY